MDMLTLISPHLIGVAIVVLLLPESSLRGAHLILTLILGTGLGLGITSAAIFVWLVIFGHAENAYLAVESGLAILLALLAGYRHHHAMSNKREIPATRFDSRPPTIGWLKISFITLLVISLVSFLIKAFLENPHGIWDAWDTWNYRARWLFRGGDQWSNAFFLRARDGLDYPILTTASIFRMWQILGKDHVAIPILVAAFFTYGSILLTFSSLVLLRGSNQGYLAAIFMFISTQLFNVGTYQYADVPLAFFILSTFILFSLQDREPKLTFQIALLAGLSSSCAAWTKNEGILFYVLSILVHFGGQIRHVNRSRLIREFFSFLGGSAPILSTLIYFKVNFARENVHLNSDTLKQLATYVLESERYLLVLTRFANKFITFNDGIVWLMAAYLLISGWERPFTARKAVRSHVAILCLLLCGYFCIYFMTPDPRAFLSASLRRIVIQVWPSWIFIYFYCVKGPEKS